MQQQLSTLILPFQGVAFLSCSPFTLRALPLSEDILGFQPESVQERASGRCPERKYTEPSTRGHLKEGSGRKSEAYSFGFAPLRHRENAAYSNPGISH